MKLLEHERRLEFQEAENARTVTQLEDKDRELQELQRQLSILNGMKADYVNSIEGLRAQLSKQQPAPMPGLSSQANFIQAVRHDL